MELLILRLARVRQEIFHHHFCKDRPAFVFEALVVADKGHVSGG